MAHYLHNFAFGSSQEVDDNHAEDQQTSTVGFSPFPMIVVTCVTLLLSWRLWKFTIKPSLRPKNEPFELPYWIPSKLSARCHRR